MRFCSPLHLNSHELEGADFLESWGKFHECVQGRENAEEIYQEFAFGLWRLWKNRNEVVFSVLHRQPLEVVDLWRKNINEFRATSASVEVDDWAKEAGSSKAAARPALHWQRPKYGTIKINTDAAWCKKTHCAGVGWVGLDFAEVLQAAGGSGTELCHSTAAAEAIAIRTALAVCINHGFNHVFVESDAKLIIQMLRKEMSADFSLDYVLGDIEILARKLTSVTFAFVPGESNHAAHLVAKYVFKEGREFIWDCVGPAFLFNALAKDVNLMIHL
ncbi:uncharacterized protein LOC126603092 [Malus sylvestris]|uniref:uncharacterized protein LOC126603092 n=1 Tax=Malus sylvestris TaxID=3752 RepID=UPI0021AD47FE|nr:uncharacterized protein LOC126603092 [Malus sylvestris]